jgi:hypothetical protein
MMTAQLMARQESGISPAQIPAGQNSPLSHSVLFRA